MKKIGLIFVAFYSIALVVSCSYNKDKLPEPVIGGVGTPSDTIISSTTVVTYTNHVKEIMDNNCVSCHSPGVIGQLPFLTNYLEVKLQSSTDRIPDRGLNALGGPMPPSGLMPQTTLDTLQLWIDQGFLE